MGVYPHEKHSKQDLLVDLTLVVDFTKSLQSDQLADTIDYDQVCALCHQIANQKHTALIEVLAHTMLQQLFKKFPLLGASICIKKPGAIKNAACAIVELQQGDLG